MRREVLLAAVVAMGSLAVPSSSEAAPIIGATSVSSPQGAFGGFPLENIINQSGLSAVYVSGATDFDTFTAATTGAGLSGSGFTGQQDNGPQQFIFDLGGAQTIDALAIWNSGSVGSISRFEVYADNDGNFANGTTGLLVGPSPLGTNASPAQVFAFAGTSTRYVIFNGLASLAPPDFYGLNEVAFRGASDVPEPATLLLAGLGAAAAIRRRRR